jgi:TRAP-type C4-dicarboxylate transport system permease large subunit
MATIGGCAGFAAVCGSRVATAATMGTVALPEMKKRGYDPALATGCVAAGGTLGILIPPSIGFIVYGVITQQSIGKLFLAGFLPGILVAGLFIATIYILCRLNPLWDPGARSFKEKI